MSSFEKLGDCSSQVGAGLKDEGGDCMLAGCRMFDTNLTPLWFKQGRSSAFAQVTVR